MLSSLPTFRNIISLHSLRVKQLLGCLPLEYKAVRLPRNVDKQITLLDSYHIGSDKASIFTPNWKPQMTLTKNISRYPTAVSSLNLFIYTLYVYVSLSYLWSIRMKTLITDNSGSRNNFYTQNLFNSTNEIWLSPAQLLTFNNSTPPSASLKIKQQADVRHACLESYLSVWEYIFLSRLCDIIRACQVLWQWV